MLKEQQWISPIATEELYQHGDPDKAVRDGARTLYGLEDVDFRWEETIRYMGIYHAIPPAEEALKCADCHLPEGRMDWPALGYDRDPDPMEVTAGDSNE